MMGSPGSPARGEAGAARRWGYSRGNAGPPQVSPSDGPAAARELPEVQARMLAVMSADPVMLETLAQRQRLPLATALAALQTLELTGLVQRQLDGSYVRCP